jgi:hypothetical protein
MRLNEKPNLVPLLVALTLLVVAVPTIAKADPCSEATERLNKYMRSYDEQRYTLDGKRTEAESEVQQAQQQAADVHIPHYLGEFGVNNSEVDDAEQHLDNVKSQRRELDSTKLELQRQKNEACGNLDAQKSGDN